MKRLLLALTLLTLFTTTAQADSLVCQYFVNGEYKTLIYTEVEEAKPNQVILTYSHGQVIFGNGSQLQMSSQADCVFVRDKAGKEQVALNHFLKQIGLSDLD